MKLSAVELVPKALAYAVSIGIEGSEDNMDRLCKKMSELAEECSYDEWNNDKVMKALIKCKVREVRDEIGMGKMIGGGR